jgi:thiamine pyrophosphate-dependent acetolactate synthase large subunit-like protein
MRGSTLIARILRLEGVEQVFCFPYTPILDALADEGIRPIVARQERVAENMADGFSRATNGRRLGVVTVQQNAGAENAFAGIAQASTDSSPLLFLPGHSGRGLVGVPPTFDACRHYAAATKWADLIPLAARIPDRLRRAFTLLRSGRPGPVLLEVPVDVAAEECGETVDYRPVPRAIAGADPDAVRDAARLLLAAERPMIWAGQGVLYAEASRELHEVAELLAAPTMTTLLGKSAFDERQPLALGVGAYARTDLVVDALRRADAVFAVGASLTRTLFAPEIPPGKRLVHATNDPRDLNKDYVADVPLLGDARLVLAALAEELRRQGGVPTDKRAAVGAHLAELRRPWNARWAAKLRSDEAPLNPYRVIGELMRTLDPARSIVTHDSGNPRDQLVCLYEAPCPRSYLGWGHSTQLGFSLGAAMGAKLACPDKTVVNVMGDAAFGMVGMDVETAVRERIPIVTVLLNNSAMGNYEVNIPRAVARYGTKRLSGQYAAVAAGLGAHAQRVERPADIRPALQRALAAAGEGRPALVECITREEPDMPIPTAGH